MCEDLPLPLAHVGDKKVKRFHFSEIIGRLPYMRATVTVYDPFLAVPGLILVVDFHVPGYLDELLDVAVVDIPDFDQLSKSRRA